MCIFHFHYNCIFFVSISNNEIGKRFKKKTRIGYDIFFVRKNFVVENLLFERELHLLKKCVSLK